MVGAIKKSIKICSLEHLNGKLKTIKNIFSSLGYPGKIIESVVEETTSPKSFEPEKCPVYIRIPYFGQTFERFTHRLSKEIENVYHTIKLRPVLGTIKPLSGTNKDVQPTKKAI